LVSSRYLFPVFSGAYEANPAGRKQNKESRPYKAPLVPASKPKCVIGKTPEVQGKALKEDVEDKAKLFDWIMNSPEPSASPSKEALPRAPTPPKAAAPPKVSFERGVSWDHPDTVNGILRKISDLPVSMTVVEICSILPAVADGVKKWVARWGVEVGPEELKFHSRTHTKGLEFAELPLDPSLYSCPLGYLACLVGPGEHLLSALVDSGLQLNIILDAMSKRFNLTLWCSKHVTNFQFFILYIFLPFVLYFFSLSHFFSYIH
jgi:hypothetical protein